jgi:hypothetical protein
MAKPPTAAKFADLLRSEGLKVIEHGDWETHNRNSKGAWGPLNGVMIHHTVTEGTNYSVQLCRDGHSTLPGPLCHGVIAKDGTVHLVGYGRANHAGLGDPDVLRAVVAETALPVDNQATVDGNAHFYGFECVNLGDGKDPWPEAQLEAIEMAAAALCRYHRWSSGSVIGHLEWQPGKPDPRGFSMNTMRARIADRLKQQNKPAPLPAPQKPKVDLSKLIIAANSDPEKRGTPVSYSGVKTVEVALVNAGLLEKRFSDGHYGTTTLDAYSAWQRKCGYTGQAADGIPGRDSLTRLGNKYGFEVVS